MAIVAQIKFVQGGNIGTAGEALIGTLGTVVTASNGNDAGVSSWQWTMLDVPPGSAVPTGVISTTSTASFTPDLRGGYRVEFEGKSGDGSRKIDRRVFQVPESSGRLVPPFGADATELNFGGDDRGWAPIMEDWLREAVDSTNQGTVSSTGTINDLGSFDGDSVAFGAIRFTGAAPSITGIAGGYPGRKILLLAAGTTLSLTEEDSGSSMTNRITTGSGTLTLAAGSAAILYYDGGSSRWKVASGGGGGSSAVANDIAKTGGIIDTVQGFVKKPLVGTPTLGETWVRDPGAYTAGGDRYKATKPVPPSWFNVKDYGAMGNATRNTIGTGTDDTDAFRRAIRAAQTQANYAGSVVYVPDPGQGKAYRLSGNIDLTRLTDICGVGGPNAYNPSCLQFDKPLPGGPQATGIIVHSSGSANNTVTPVDGTGGDASNGASGSIIRNLRLLSGDLTLTTWLPTHAYSVGDRIRRTDDNRYYMECIVAGTSAGTEPDWTAVSGRIYCGGASPDTTGQDHVVDGGVTWLNKLHCGVLFLNRGRIENCEIEAFTNAGVVLYGEDRDQHSNVNGCLVLYVAVNNCGIGIYVRGGDANANLIMGCDVEGAGFLTGGGALGTGGVGLYDGSFLGNTWIGNQASANTGRCILDAAGLPFSVWIGHYTEAGLPNSIQGVNLGGDHAVGLEGPWTGFNSVGEVARWHNIGETVYDNVHLPTLHLGKHDSGQGNPFLRRTWRGTNEGQAVLGDRYRYGSQEEGHWVTGMGGDWQRDIFAVTGPTANIGPGNFRVYNGEFRGTSSPYWLGYTSNTTDPFVRASADGVPGQLKAGDRFEYLSSGALIGKVVVKDGWTASATWGPSSTFGWGDAIGTDFQDGLPRNAIHPTTPNGFTYVSCIAGTSGGSEPTWPTSFLGNGGIVPKVWAPGGHYRRIGDYAVPTTANGHYYKCTSVTSPDVDGFGLTGGTEPTWPIGSGSTVVDGAITWTEQGSDVGTYVLDNGIRWQCVGPEPVFVQYIPEGPHGWYDPRQYGAKFDGKTDDLPALQAMHAALPVTGARVLLPPGFAWLSDTWRISKPIELVGIGGTGQGNCGFEVAPGREAAIAIDYSGISLDGHDGTLHLVERIDIKSRILVHGTNYGSTGGHGIDNTYSSGAVFRKGDCFVKTSNASPTVFFRARLAGTFPTGGEPSWNTTVGGTTSVNGVTFDTEAFPTVRANTTHYDQGARVYAINDNRYIFRCTVAGTTAGSPPTQMLGGNSAGGVEIGATFSDGSVTWITDIAVGIYCNTNLGIIKRIHGQSFTGAVVHVQGGTGQDARGTTNADNERLQEIYALASGLGVYLGGNDSNGCNIDGLFAVLMGFYQPFPNATGLGGHILHDHSQGGATVANLYAQLSTGRAVLKNGPGNATFFGCFQELSLDSFFDTGQSLILGGSIRPTQDSTNVIILNQSIGRGIKQVDNIDANARYVELQSFDAQHQNYKFWTDDDNGNSFSWQYGSLNPTGWWSLNWGVQGGRTAFYISSKAAGIDPSPGWFGVPQGQLLGSPSSQTPLFEGRLSTFQDTISPDTDFARFLREGLRRKGDRFRDDATSVVLTSDGYCGKPWQASTSYSVRSTPWNIPASVVEPTANTRGSNGGEQVWVCTTAGTSGGTEPSWPVSPTPGVTTQTDGGVTWTFLGSRPSFVRQLLPTADLDYTKGRTKKFQTTTNAASQVIDDGVSWEGLDFTLSPSATTVVKVSLLLKKHGAADGGSIELAGTYYRNTTGNPVNVPTDDNVPKLSSGVSGVTAALVINNTTKAIEVQVSPGSTITLDWTIVRSQFEVVE